MDFDLNLLRVLVSLDDTRNVTRAAQQLGMSQSGLSTALNRLRLQFEEGFVDGAQFLGLHRAPVDGDHAGFLVKPGEAVERLHEGAVAQAGGERGGGNHHGGAAELRAGGVGEHGVVAGGVGGGERGKGEGRGGCAATLFQQR